MRFDVVTLFPSFIKEAFSYGVIGRAIKNRKIELETWDPRKFSDDREGRIDDRPYGGGPGMIMQARPLIKSIEAAERKSKSSYIVSMCPKGKLFNHKKAQEFVSKPHLILICGRYEGIDQRVLDQKVHEECSIGDYVLSGGEIPALIIIEAVSRFVPGVLGDPDSTIDESFSNGLLEYPQFTRPESDDYGKVPKVLLSGDHKKILQWRLKQSMLKTYRSRPDLLDQRELTEEESTLLEEIISEEKG